MEIFCYLQKTKCSLDKAALDIIFLTQLSLQDSLLFCYQAEDLNWGGQQELGVRAETRIYTTKDQIIWMVVWSTVPPTQYVH